MDHLKAALLDSWDRQVNILDNVLAYVNEDTKNARPAPEGWSIYEHFCHIHETRYWWLKTASPIRAEALGDLYLEQEGQYTAIPDLALIKEQLAISAKAIRDEMEEALDEDKLTLKPYDHPVLFLQHMVWHEGYHYGLITLALRNVGAEPDNAWSDSNVWELWRGPEEW